MIHKEVEKREERAIKNDQGKPSYTSMPQLALLEVVKQFTYGKEKYGKYNYSGDMDISRYLDALWRHLNQYLTGEDIDESGAHHLACVACNALMALDSILTSKGVDDRNKNYIGIKSLKEIL